MFQFLIVQLKDRMINVSKRCDKVFQFLIVQLKESKNKIINNANTRFQFLIVQLKEGIQDAQLFKTSSFNSL